MNAEMCTMATQETTLSTGIAGQTVSTRLASIDIFRGLTMAVMIFVNELSSVKGMPWWTDHAPGKVDVMTYVDMVFPFFLFILGVSMPIAVAQRLKRDPSMLQLWKHVIIRAFSLIVLGYVLANAEKADPGMMPLSGGAWAFGSLVCAALYLNTYVGTEGSAKLFKVLKYGGLIGLAILLALFRRTTRTGQVAWLAPGYPEILGLIGFSYLATSILYIPTRRSVWAACVWLVGLTAFCCVATAKMLHFPNHLPLYVWPFGNGSMPSIIMAGVVTHWIFLGSRSRDNIRRVLLQGAAFGVLLLVAGSLLTPLGISKIRATPTWCLYSSGAAVLIFTALYWLCDVKKRTAWASFVRPAGANTLLTYLLPDLWYFFFVALGVTYFDTHLSAGLPGVFKAVIFTGLMLTFAAILTRLKVRLQL
jgi:heparan-alpha-glucosaminide N-acetyltransferase